MADVSSSDSEDARVLQAMEHLLALKEHPGWLILMQQLAIEAAAAREALVDADPTDARGIAVLQGKAQRMAWFAGTVDELLNSIRNDEVLAEIEEEEDHDG